MKVQELSVFFPLFNEEGNVETIVEKATKVLEDLKLKYEIILVNDGSTDNTKEVIDKIASKNSQVKAIHHPTNLGYGEALKSGFYNAKYDYIVYTDGDNQFDFAQVSRFLEKIENSDLVIGYRIKRQDPLFRILFKKGWKFSLLVFFGLTLRDVDCGFKMVRRSVLEKIPHLESQRGAMINAELVIKAKKAGFKISQVGVDHFPRLSGKPTGASINVILKSYMDLVKLWWKLKDEKIYFILLILVLALAAFLRLYKINQYMIFLGDEGRDALIVKEMVKGNHFPLIGPPTSVGNIYLGPLYYYLMFIPMALTNLNPVSASVMIAIIGVLTVALIYFLGKSFFNRKAGLIASFLYAISPVTIAYSNFSWNPNPLPFFALLTLLGFYKAYQGSAFWLILSGASLAAAIQMHYLALILIPVFIIWWFFLKREKKDLFLGITLGLLAFLVVMFPLFWFDLRHNFLNYRAITTLFSQKEQVSGNIISNFSKIPQIFSFNLVGRYIAGGNMLISYIISALIILRLFFVNFSIKILGSWLIVGLLGISFYQADVYDHYLGFLNPAPFLLLGGVAAINFPKKWKWVVSGGLLLLLTILTYLNLSKNPLLLPPNNQLERTKQIAQFVIEKSEGKDFNFALLAKSNYDSAYVFYLEQFGHKPKQVPAEKTDQLFVVCEDEKCDPTHDAKYELAAFGMSKIQWQEEKFGVKIYKLISNPSGKP